MGHIRVLCTRSAPFPEDLDHKPWVIPQLVPIRGVLLIERSDGLVLLALRWSVSGNYNSRGQSTVARG